MSLQIKNNWNETIERFDAWFHNKPCDRPLINAWANREEGDFLIPERLVEEPYSDLKDRYLNPDKRFTTVMNWFCRDIKPVAEAFPEYSINLGAGSMALYLGAEPDFAPDTLWFKHFVEDYSDVLPLTYDPENIWWKKHLEIIRRQVELAKDTDILIGIPDIVENIDILSALRNPQDCCYDLYDYPDEVKQALDNITKLYPVYYDAIYDIVKREDGVSAYTVFNIAAHGKTAKVQCDFGAMMSPEHFKEFIIPTLKEQCSKLDNTLFHLDGPECIPHVDALMTLENLGALQWTYGARNPGSADERWFDMYKKVKEAGKGLWFSFDDPPEKAIADADKIVKKFGHQGLFFNFPRMSQKLADELMIKAEKEWKI